MAEGEAGGILTEKVGPLPLVIWVIGGAGVIFIFMMMRNKGNSGSQGVTTNQVSALAPTEAEAFGTIEQQQQDVTNALSTLGNNQAALGGSMNTLSGIITQQGQQNAASFQNLLNGQQTIEQGQTSAASASSTYYTNLLSSIQTYYQGLAGSLNSVSGQVSAGNAAQASGLQQLLQALQGVSGQVSGVSGQVSGVSAQQQADATAQRYGFANTDALLAYLFYQMPNRYAAYFPASVNAGSNVSGAEGQVTSGIGTAQPGWSTQVT